MINQINHDGSTDGIPCFMGISTLDRIISLLTKGSSGYGTFCTKCKVLKPAFAGEDPIINVQASNRQVLLRFGMSKQKTPSNYRGKSCHGVSFINLMIDADHDLQSCSCCPNGEVYDEAGVIISKKSPLEIQDEMNVFNLMRKKQVKLGHVLKPLVTFNDSLVVANLLQLLGERINLPHFRCALQELRAFLSLARDSDYLDPKDPEVFWKFSIPFLIYHLDLSYDMYINYVKWWSTTWLAKHLHQQVEDGPFEKCDLFFGLRGGLRLRLRNRVRSRCTKKHFKFLCGVQQIKRAACIVPDSFIEKQYIKHMKAMSKLPTSDFDQGYLYPTNPSSHSLSEKMKQRRISKLNKRVGTNNGVSKRVIKDIVDNKFSRECTDDAFLYRFELRCRNILRGFIPRFFDKYSPSNSACLELSRSAGGQNQQIQEVLGYRYRGYNRPYIMPKCIRIDHTSDETLPIEYFDGFYKKNDQLRVDFIQGKLFPPEDFSRSMIDDTLFSLNVHKGFRIEYFIGNHDQSIVNISRYMNCECDDVCHGRGWYLRCTTLRVVSADLTGFNTGLNEPEETSGYKVMKQRSEFVIEYNTDLDLEEQKARHIAKQLKIPLFNEYGNNLQVDKDGNYIPINRFDPTTLTVRNRSIWDGMLYPLIGSVGELISMDFHPNVGVKETHGFPIPNLKLLARDYIDGMDEFSSLIPPRRDLFHNYTPVLEARVAGVCEPFKVRPVTKGPAIPYWLSKSYQKSLHGYIKQFPQFDLSGSELELAHFNMLRDKSRFHEDEDSDPIWVSGDYSGATDNVDIRLTKICHRVAMEQADQCCRDHLLDCNGSDYDNIKNIITRTIMPHIISYPEKIMTEELQDLFYDFPNSIETKESIRSKIDDLLEEAQQLQDSDRVDDIEAVRQIYEQIQNLRNTEVIDILDDDRINLRNKTFNGTTYAIGNDEPIGILQKNGQLMGSPISFPYLCLINFIAAWEAVYPYIDDFRDVPIKVNGDDILFRCPRQQYQNWVDMTENAGFQLSVGKNFSHSKFLFINSQPWIYDRNGHNGGTFKYCPFFNQGLMSGQSKVGKVSSIPFSDIMKPTYALQPEAVLGANNIQVAIGEFYHRHSEHIKEVTCDGYFSATLPTEYLGLGMVSGDRDYITKQQRRICSVTLDRALNNQTICRPECLDDKYVPYFKIPLVQGPQTTFRGDICVKAPSAKSCLFLTPYFSIDNFPEKDESGYHPTKICTSRSIRRMIDKDLKSKVYKFMPKIHCQEGFRISSHPYIDERVYKFEVIPKSFNRNGLAEFQNHLGDISLPNDLEFLNRYQLKSINGDIKRKIKR